MTKKKKTEQVTAEQIAEALTGDKNVPAAGTVTIRNIEKLPDILYLAADGNAYWVKENGEAKVPETEGMLNVSAKALKGCTKVPADQVTAKVEDGIGFKMDDKYKTDAPALETAAPGLIAAVNEAREKAKTYKGSGVPAELNALASIAIPKGEQAQATAPAKGEPKEKTNVDVNKLPFVTVSIMTPVVPDLKPEDQLPKGIVTLNEEGKFQLTTHNGKNLKIPKDLTLENVIGHLESADIALDLGSHQAPADLVTFLKKNPEAFGFLKGDAAEALREKFSSHRAVYTKYADAAAQKAGQGTQVELGKIFAGLKSQESNEALALRLTPQQLNDPATRDLRDFLVANLQTNLPPREVLIKRAKDPKDSWAKEGIEKDNIYLRLLPETGKKETLIDSIVAIRQEKVYKDAPVICWNRENGSGYFTVDDPRGKYNYNLKPEVSGLEPADVDDLIATLLTCKDADGKRVEGLPLCRFDLQVSSLTPDELGDLQGYPETLRILGDIVHGNHRNHKGRVPATTVLVTDDHTDLNDFRKAIRSDQAAEKQARKSKIGKGSKSFTMEELMEKAKGRSGKTPNGGDKKAQPVVVNEPKTAMEAALQEALSRTVLPEEAPAQEQTGGSRQIAKFNERYAKTKPPAETVPPTVLQEVLAPASGVNVTVNFLQALTDYVRENGAKAGFDLLNSAQNLIGATIASIGTSVEPPARTAQLGKQ